MKHLAAALALVLGASSAVALPVGADITETLDSPAFGIGPRILQDLGESFGAQVELDVDDEVQNPSGWNGLLEVDVASDGLSFVLTHVEMFTDYQMFELTIDNVLFSTPGERIVDVSRVGPSIVRVATASFTETVSFGNDFISLVIELDDVDGNERLFFQGGGSASYAITTRVDGAPGAEVPLPAAAPLLAAGLAGLGWAARRRRRG
ncbi:MAG: VPLPA-CTERM sorting domain-containing protein [Pseudomonadota bacterium]